MIYALSPIRLIALIDFMECGYGGGRGLLSYVERKSVILLNLNGFRINVGAGPSRFVV